MPTHVTELNAEILRRIVDNDAIVAGVRLSQQSLAPRLRELGCSRIEELGEMIGTAIGNSRQLLTLEIGCYCTRRPMATSLLLPLLRGLARNRSIQQLDLVNLDLSQVANRGHDIFSFITPFLRNQCLRCINILWCKLPQNVSSLSFALSKCNQLEKIKLLQHNHGDHSNSVAGRITRASFINSLRCQQNSLELTIYGQIEGNGYVELAALLSHYASKITSLRLNSIPSDESLTILSIKKFEFFSNRLDNITATGWRAFSAVLSDKTCALETLSLECTKMDDESATFLGDSLAANTTVKFLSLQGSRYITPGGWDGFACCLRSPHSALEELDISMCNSANDDESDEEDDSDENDTPLNDYGAIAIAESLAMNSSLKKLNLSWNWITPEGWIEFFDVLLHSECSLEELDLSHNDIDDEGVDALVDLLASMRNFHTLSLHHNSFSMTGLRALTRLLQPSYNVESIILGRTEELFLQSERDRFNDEVAIEFADVLANNTSLNTLSFGGREVTGRGWTAFYHALCDKSSIDSTFSSNHSLHAIEGINGLREDIPDDLSSLLNMNRNQDKAAVARQKVLEQHFSSSSATIEVFVGMSASALPHAIEWIG